MLSPGDFAQWVVSLSAASGVVYSIIRNGKRQRDSDTKLKTELKMEIDTIKKRLDDPDNGLSAIKKATEEMKLHCARVSTTLCTRVENLEKAK